jgi:hypothetical protein
LRGESTTLGGKIIMKRFAYGALVAGVLAVPAVSFAQQAEGPNGSVARSPSTAASGPSTAQDDTEHLPPGVLTSVTAGER